MSKLIFEEALAELEAHKEDIRPSDFVLFSEPLCSVLNFMTRLGRFSLTEFSEKLELTREQTKHIADQLVERRLFVVSGFSNDEETFYESRVSALTRPLTRPPSDIWKKIE